MIGSKKKSRLFAHYLIPYLITLLIPVLLGLVIYTKTVSVIEEDAKNENISLLERSMSALDQRVNEIEMIIAQILSNGQLHNFMYKANPHQFPQAYSIIETRDSMFSFMSSNNFILDYYVLFNKSSLVLAPDFTYTFPQFYDMVLKYEGMDYSEWYQFIYEQRFHRTLIPSHKVYYKDRELSIITYMHSVVGFPMDNNACIMLLIDEKEIVKHLTGINLERGGWVYIVDNGGNIISGLSGSNEAIEPVQLDLDASRGVVQQTLNGEAVLVSYVTSDQTGWKYVAVQPTTVVTSKVSYMKNLIYIVIFLTLSIGISTAYYMAYRNTVPVKDMIDTIKSKYGKTAAEGKSEFDFIRNTISTLINDNESMQAAVQQQIPFLRVSFFNSLLKGEFHTEEEISVILKYTGLNMQWNNYFVVIVQITEEEESLSHEGMAKHENKKIILKEALKYYPIQVHDMDIDKIVIFACCPDDRKNAKDYVESLKCKIDESLPYDIKFNMIYAVGGIYENIMYISDSYMEALHALRFFVKNNGQEILYYNEVPAELGIYYYPTDMENKLINLTRAGDSEGVRDQLRKLYIENLLKRKLPESILDLFIYDLWATVMKIVSQIPVEDIKLNSIRREFENIQQHNHMNKFQLTADVFIDICDIVVSQKAGQNSMLVDNIYDFIHSHYTQSDLSLSYIAQEFSMSETYMTVFFKQKTGRNIYEYIENIRIEKAQELLTNTTLNINEISENVGFSSSNTFCRAFKRLTGVNATTYRRSKLKNHV